MSEHVTPSRICTDCGKRMVWERADGTGALVCPQCVMHRLRAYERAEQAKPPASVDTDAARRQARELLKRGEAGGAAAIGELSGDLDALRAECERLRGVIQALLDDVRGLALESEGVAGLHLNGDLATWAELFAPNGHLCDFAEEVRDHE